MLEKVHFNSQLCLVSLIYVLGSSCRKSLRKIKLLDTYSNIKLKVSWESPSIAKSCRMAKDLLITQIYFYQFRELFCAQIIRDESRYGSRLLWMNDIKSRPLIKAFQCSSKYLRSVCWTFSRERSWETMNIFKRKELEGTWRIAFYCWFKDRVNYCYQTVRIKQIDSRFR